MSINLKIRAAEVDDAEAVFEIAAGEKVRHGTLQMPFDTLTATRERLATQRPGAYRLVAESEGQVIGMLGLTVVDSQRRRHAGQLGMMVHDDYQGRGVGKALLRAAIDLADNWLNLHRVELEVYTDNAAGIHLYESHGFVIEGTMRDYAFRDGSYIDAHTMGRVGATARSKD